MNQSFGGIPTTSHYLMRTPASYRHRRLGIQINLRVNWLSIVEWRVAFGHILQLFVCFSNYFNIFQYFTPAPYRHCHLGIHTINSQRNSTQFDRYISSQFTAQFHGVPINSIMAISSLLPLTIGDFVHSKEDQKPQKITTRTNKASHHW